LPLTLNDSASDTPQPISLKILIVDDNASVRRLIRSILLPVAGEICECTDGTAALASYQAQMPDLVLMDVRMKDMDGIAATARIFAADPRANIVIVTDYDDDVLRQAAARAGASAYILKENLLDLLAFLNSMQQGGPGWQSR
jgi:CheY-like chemotaxis protein